MISHELINDILNNISGLYALSFTSKIVWLHFTTGLWKCEFNIF